MRATLLSAVLALLMGGLVAGCANDKMHDSSMKKDKMSDSSMKMDRMNDKVMVTGAHGEMTTYVYDKSTKQPMSMSGDMKAMKCDSCKAAVAAYYNEGKMPPEKCPDCGSTFKVAKGPHGKM